MAKKSVATIYNPNLLSKKQLIGNYVVRLKKFQKLFKEIKTSSMSRPEQHILIEGQRGMGKTTLLLRLAYEVENDEALSQWLIPLVFNEEQYEVNSLSGLWELIAKYLEEQGTEFRGLFDEMDSNYARFEDGEEYEKFIFILLIRALKRANKKILLFIDNFGDMFKKLEGESQRLREILITCEHLRIIAASSVISEAFFKYEEPLYEFFKIEKLNELNLEETKSLLLKLGETHSESKIKEIVENEPARIETLRRLTGGVIRTIVLLFEIFIDDETGNAFKDLESVLDRVTPLYKHRMDDLGPQPQAIVHTIAMNWDAIAVKDIAKKTRIPSKTISAQLQKLVTNGIILKTETNTKNHLYSLRERFFNIWYLMRNGRKGDQNRVIWLARFFENWLNPKDWRKRVEKFLQIYEEGVFEDEQIMYLRLLYMHPILNTPRYLIQEILLKVTPDYTTDVNRLKTHRAIFNYKLHNNNFEFSQQEFKELLYTSAISLTAKRRIIEGFEHLSETAFINTIKTLKKEKSYLKEKAIALFDGKDDCEENYLSLGNLYKRYLSNNEQGLYFLSKAADLGYYDNYELGKLYLEEQDLNNAQKYFIHAYEDDGNEKALIELGDLHRDKFNELEEAQKYYKESYHKTGNRSAIFRYAWISSKLGQHEEGIKAYLEFVRLPGYKGNAYWNLANIFRHRYKYDEAEKYYLMAIKEGQKDAERHLASMYMHNMNRYNEGEEMLKRRIKEYGDTEAMNSLAWAYYLMKINKKEALAYSKMSLQKDKNIYKVHTSATILLWNDEIEVSIKLGKEFLSNPRSFEDFSDDIIDYLLLLIAKKAYTATYELFSSKEKNNYNLKDRYKPIYFALMTYMKDEYPSEYLKMGSELKETVQEIIEKIEQKRIDYS